MKITLYMAISIDGCITRGEDDSDWVSETDWDEFQSFIEASDGIIMGRKTMEQFGEDFPVANTTNIVLSHDEQLHKQEDKLVIMSGTPQEVVSKAEELGLKNLLLIGGENTNGQFLKENLVDEIVLSVHPLVIGKGLRLFGDMEFNTELKLISALEINSELVQLRYEVI